METYYTYVDTPVGPFLLAGDREALHVASFTAGQQHRRPEPNWMADERPIAYAAEQLREYFAGTRTDFDVPLLVRGGAFQRTVWEALCAIPFGETRSYMEVARAVGSPLASRAVGAANRANSLPIFIPCHRVIGADGQLTGFGGGLATKRWLLEFEAHKSLQQPSLF